MRRTLTIAALLALPLGTLAACGGDDSEEGGDTPSGSPSGPPPEGGLRVIALDSLAFDRESYAAEAGDVTFLYENDGSLLHTLLVEGVDADTFKLEVGDTDEGSVELEPGEYTLYCDVAGHQAAGMEATLTVE